ncbi:MAG: hypothetical protein LBU91_07150, partial [Bacteroidales bacterium]|nr:hypothetical protein [Bacteroidales bacterium]
YIIGTQCSSCGGISPYQNFVDDSENYKILTSKLRDSYYNSSVIDHILISNELVANYVNESAGQETDAAKLISNYRQTASDHMPVSIILDFATSSAFNPTVRMHDHVSIKAWTSNGEINISGLNSGEAFQIYTISGMLVYQSVATNSQVETWRSASVQHGTYIIRQGQRAAKIVL